MDIPQITAEDVKKSLDLKEDVTLLDVRTQDEVSRGKIENSINIPIEEIESKILSLIPDKNKRIFIYCLSGSRSSVAVDIMKKLGYSNVFSMTSGLLAWRSKSYPLIS